MKQFLKQAYYGKGIMETGNHSTNGANPKSQTSRRNCLLMPDTGDRRKTSMTKIVILLAIFFGSMVTLSAQDIITLKNGDEIKAKVQEIGISDVKYKKFENVTGPTYTIMKTEIFMIKYENGEKDVFNTQNQPVQEKQPLTPDVPNAQQNNYSTPVGSDGQQNEYSHINDMTKRSKVTLREKHNEIGIQLDGGSGYSFSSDSEGKYNSENNIGLIGGAGVFYDRYMNKRDIWLLGTGLSYWGHYYMPDYNADYSLSYVNWDLYFGAKDPIGVSGIKLYAKIGFRASFLNGGTISFEDGTEDEAKSYFNPTVFGMMTEWGYPGKRFDFGIKAFLMFTNVIKSDAFSGGNMSSGIWGMTFTCAYKFSF
jgi:hypothetical protein